MKVPQYSFVCVNNHTFLSPLILKYGEFVLRSNGQGTPRYMFAINDEVYDEVDKMLASLQDLKQKNGQGKSEILQKIFGIACDLDVDGSEFQIGSQPKCPECGSRKMYSCDLPSEPSTEEIQEITHDSWQKLTPTAKLERLRNRLEKLGYIDDKLM